MKRHWEGMGKFVKTLWYEETPVCIFCGQEGHEVCPACTADCLHPELGRCRSCGKLISPEEINCQDCLAGQGPKYLDRVTAWGYYAGGLQEFIRKMKFDGRPRRVLDIARPFADWAVRQLPVVEGVVAVPMHTSRLLERGFNQAEVLASALHWQLGLPIIEGVERIKPTPSQVLLSRQDRLQNLQDAFVLRDAEQFTGRRLWLVDDVTTTGATLEAVAKSLRAGGASEIYGLCLAAGMEKT